MAIGDHIKVDRIFYSHHGIEVENSNVIHFSGNLNEKKDAIIKITSMDEFMNGENKRIIFLCEKCKPLNEVLKTAHHHIGSKGYSLLFNNCEHFAKYCKTGDKNSKQVSQFFENILQLGTAGIPILSITIFSVSQLIKAKQDKFEEIIVEGDLAYKLKASSKINKKALALIIASVGLLPLSAGLSSIGILGVSMVTGTNISLILSLASIGFGFINELFKEYEEVDYKKNKLILRKKNI